MLKKLLFRNFPSYIAATFTILLARILEARKIKWPVFLQTKGSTSLKRKSIDFVSFEFIA